MKDQAILKVINPLPVASVRRKTRRVYRLRSKFVEASRGERLEFRKIIQKEKRARTCANRTKSKANEFRMTLPKTLKFELELNCNFRKVSFFL